MKTINPFFFEVNKIFLAKRFLSVSLLIFFSLFILSGQVCASAIPLPDENINNPDTDYFLSCTNFSSDEITDWRNTEPNVYFGSEIHVSRYNYSVVFFPGISGDEKLAGYYMKVLPNGVSTSYAEIIDAGAAPPSPDTFLSRAEVQADNMSDSLTEAMNSLFGHEILFFDGYSEIARHTTVRDYLDIGKVTVTTVLYQYLNDGDPDRDYFCIGSHVEMKAENESGNMTGWKNSEFSANYNFATGYDSLKSLDAPAAWSHPQTSSKYMQSRGDPLGGFLNAFDRLGLFAGLFGHSVVFNAENFNNLTWTARCGYFTESASGSLGLSPVIETMPKQTYVDDSDWHVLAGVGIGADSGWSRLGGLVREPSDSPECISYILVHKVPDGNYSGNKVTPTLIVPGKSHFGASEEYLNPNSGEIRAGENMTFVLRIEKNKELTGNETINVTGVSEYYSENQVPLPQGINVTCIPSEFVSYPKNNYSVNVNITTTKDVPENLYHFLLKRYFRLRHPNSSAGITTMWFDLNVTKSK
ncbi:hypothetical protein J2128_000317 [Methanomicrobium sp. W14]|uniref:hypothetical protein n=1 Tax=Methanomicrobium sp. W14 TaxID=2817839 RepID=UPI001AE738A1|nr:hypothetical protein [Methanomicrobium sp. W14]MBP2132396.1 hypothetical protein [Methanomicrobium sp. W14]